MKDTAACISHTVYPVDRFFKKMKMTLTLLLSVNIVIYLWYSHRVNDMTWLELIWAFFAFENIKYIWYIIQIKTVGQCNNNNMVPIFYSSEK